VSTQNPSPKENNDILAVRISSF